ncbi:MAG: hypothetical protein AAFQ89_23930 [Cyanobacteria bacterium J06626_18]
MSSNTVILDTARLPRVAGRQINGPISYKSFADNSPKGKNSPEIRSVWLIPGPNHNISDEDIAVLQKSDVGKQHLALDAIVIITPNNLEEGATATATSMDYDEATALTIIRGSEDEEWLELSKNKEDRPAVRQAIAAQIDAIQKQLVALAKNSAE